MTRWILGSTLRLAPVMVAAAAVLLFLGVSQTRHAPVDALPEFGPAQVQVQTEALGLSATEVEQFITVPLEDELNGIAYLDRIHSRSIPGLSAIDLTFQPGTDLLRARQLVTERLAQGPGVANVAAPPVMIQPASSTSRVMMIGLSSKDLSLIDLSTLARWKLRPRLMGVPGVSSVAIWGQRDKQLQVQVDPAKLHARGVTLSQIIDTTGNALWSSPLTFVEASTPGSDGFIDTPSQRLAVQHVLPITSAKDLAKVTVQDNTGPQPLTLGDVTTVVEDHQPLVGDAVVDDGPGILLVVEKLPGASTVDVTRGIQDALTAMRPGLTGVSVDTTVFAPKTFVDTALRDIGITAGLGLLLLVLLIAALVRGRAALVGVLAIAVSTAAAAYVLYLRGTTFNVMILAGLVIGLGVVVDEAVGTVLAVRRALREHHARGDDRSIASVIVDACAEVRGPLGYATAVIALAVLPIALLTGIGGAFSRPLVGTYLLAVGAALLVALTVTPALAYLLLSGPPRKHWSSPRTGRTWRATRWYLGRPGWAYATVGLFLLSGLALLPQLGNHPVVPQLRDRNLVVQWQAAAGTSLPEMDALTLDASRQLRQIPGVRTVAGEVGRTLISDRVADVNSGQLWVTLDPAADYDRSVAAIRQVADNMPALTHTVSTYADQRLREVTAQTPGTPVTVRLYGQDLATLADQARRVRETLASIPGLADPTVRAPATQPGIEVQVDLAAAEKYGLKPGDIRRASTTLVNGLPAGSLYQNQQIFDVVVVGRPAVHDSLASVQNLLIDTPAGDQVRLRDVASVQVRPTPTVIEHENASRYLEVTATLTGDVDLTGLLGTVRTQVGALPFPTGYHADVFSDLALRQNADRRELWQIPAIALAVFLVLQAAFRSWRRATLLFLVLPLTLAGAVPVALAFGGVKTLGALLGLLMVFGLAVRTGVGLIRGYQSVERAERDTAPVDVVLTVTRERAPAIALSALGTALALAPFVALRSLAGGEVLAPLAAVVLGGLLTTTVILLYVLPTLYARLILRARVAAPPPDDQPTVLLPDEQPTVALGITPEPV